MTVTEIAIETVTMSDHLIMNEKETETEIDPENETRKRHVTDHLIDRRIVTDTERETIRAGEKKIV